MIKKIFIPAMVLALFIMGCDITSSDYNPPDDHTLNKGGIKHKPGLSDPAANCASCHGDDLRGGSAVVSCYECHNKKW